MLIPRYGARFCLIRGCKCLSAVGNVTQANAHLPLFRLFFVCVRVREGAKMEWGERWAWGGGGGGV